MVELNIDFFVEVITEQADMVEEHRNEWTKLDSDIGDGDHGINLSIGYRGVKEYILENDLADVDIKTFLRKIGMILLSKVGGASGPLYGSFFLKMPENLQDEKIVDENQLVQMIIDGIQGIKDRGKAEVGDKTMIDALLPGQEKLIEMQGSITKDGLREFQEKMDSGADSTIPLIAKKGRAMRLGERAVGHLDPGAESSRNLFGMFTNKLAEKL